MTSQLGGRGHVSVDSNTPAHARFNSRLSLPVRNFIAGKSATELVEDGYCACAWRVCIWSRDNSLFHSQFCCGSVIKYRGQWTIIRDFKSRRQGFQTGGLGAEIMLNTFSRSLIIESPLLKHGPKKWTGARERTGDPESWTVSQPWKLYFTPGQWWVTHGGGTPFRGVGWLDQVCSMKISTHSICISDVHQ